MSQLSVIAENPSYTGTGQNIYPIILLAPSLLSDGYTVIKDVIFEGGSGSISFVKEPVINSLTQTSAKVIGYDGSLDTGFPAFVARTLIESLNTTQKDFYPLSETDISQVNYASPPPEYVNVPDYDKTVGDGANKKAIQTITPVLRSAITNSGLVTDFKIAERVSTINSTTKEVVTNVSGGGTGSTPYTPVVSYDYNADTVGITGDGYKRMLSSLYTKKFIPKKIRFFILGNDPAFTISEILNLNSQVIEATGSKVDSSTFILSEFITPYQKQMNIIDIPFSVVFDENVALVFNVFKSSIVKYKIVFIY